MGLAQTQVKLRLEEIDAALYQIQEYQPRVITYGSRSLNMSERRYSAYRREFLALKWAATDTDPHGLMSNLEFRKDQYWDQSYS